MASGTIPQLSNETGYSNGIYYVKFPDGTLIQWGSDVFNPTSNTGTASGSVYYFEFHPNIVFPVEFYYTPSVTLTKLGGSEGAISWGQRSKTGIQGFDVIRGVQSPGDPSVDLCWIAIGRWKA